MGKLTRNQFDVLSALATSGAMTEQGLCAATGHAAEVISKTANELSASGYIADGNITEAGKAALEPYAAKRAVFIAAGFGSRLVPITLNTPKPLVRVKGKRIIDTLIDAVLAAGINEIYIVRGYLGEQFDQLLIKYPMIKFIDNEKYNEANNILSAYCARELLSNAYVFEADLYLSNPALVKKYHYESNFLSIKKERSDDWCFMTENSYIAEYGQGGEGDNCYQEVGISYWNAEDGRKLRDDIGTALGMPGGKQKYWEEVSLSMLKSHYKIAVRTCTPDDIIEIDTFNELKALDKAYDV